MKIDTRKSLFLFTAILLLLSISLSVLSLFPNSTGNNQSAIIIDNPFRLRQNETYRQGLGAFHGGENITLSVQCPNEFMKNFSIITYDGPEYVNSSNQNLTYTFTADMDYYEASFYSNSPNADWVNFKVTVQKPEEHFPYSWLSIPAKTLFLFGLTLAIIAFIKFGSPSKLTSQTENKTFSLSLKQFDRVLLVLLSLSLMVWLLFLLMNSNPLGTFENWYTDHARHAYVSSLFLKNGFSIFNQPLGILSSLDSSHFMFVTWPEMPHLYPLGSIFLFLPFGALLQNGFNAVLIFKLEIGLFLFFSHICLYFFLKNFLNKEMNLLLKLVGVYIIYVVLVVYAANGMFDSIAFLFSLFAILMFVSERYDKFFLLVAVSIFLKYQAGIFLLPLVIFGLSKILGKKQFRSALGNKNVVFGAFLIMISGTTGYFSMSFLAQSKPAFIMNGINAFLPHAQVSWNTQAVSVSLTLILTIIYSSYMLNKNVLLSFSAPVLLLPSFALPYFQNWYLPFIFVYGLIPQNRKESEATIIWLIFMVAVLSFGGVSFNLLQILGNLEGSRI